MASSTQDEILFNMIQIDFVGDFLGELIDNASDALGRIRDDPSKLFIRIKPDHKTKTLTITDSGIGMTKDELASLVNSGMSSFNEFIKRLSLGSVLIDKMTVTSKHNNEDEQLLLELADSGYIIRTDRSSESLDRGTRIVLHLKDRALKYLEESYLKDLIKKKLSKYPIQLFTQATAG